MKERLHSIVEGRVQGVGFRYYCRDTARELGLTGWVRNMPEGRRVEIVAEGETDALNSFSAWCRQGPPLAMVKSVSEQRSPATGEFGLFDIRF